VAAKLKGMIHVTATVVREGAAGEMIPGDVRVLSSTLPRIGFKNRLVRGIADDRDAHHSRHPHQQDSIFPEPRDTLIRRSPHRSAYWPILMATLLSYMALTQAIKVWLLRKNWI
jgi:hypothetical protein